MHKRILCFALMLVFVTDGLAEIESSQAQYFGADDLHLKGGTLRSYEVAGGTYILSLSDGFSLEIGDNKLKSNNAVVWLDCITTEHLGIKEVEYKITVYLQDKPVIVQGKSFMMSGVDVEHPVIEGNKTLVAKFIVNGEVFATADKRLLEDPRTSMLYRNALLATNQIELQPSQGKTVTAKGQQQPGPKLNVLEKVFGADKSRTRKPLQAGVAEPGAIKPVPKFYYPVNISSATETPIKITNENLPDGSSIATILNRFYLWQKQDETGRLLEFQSDSAVIFYAAKSNEPNNVSNLLPNNSIKAVYFRGNMIMTEGNRTIRADEAYYDFQKKKGLMVNAEIRTLDPQRGVPLYVRAGKIRQVAENKFTAKDATLTSSEFHTPQLSATASEIYITDVTSIDEETAKLGKKSYDFMMKDVKLKANNQTYFWWPRLSGNLEKPDLPLKTVRFSHDNTFGNSIETEWYLARLLGLREPPGVDSSFVYDYYSKRGTGIGADINYKRDDYFGDLNAYVINDRGKDDLGRSRQNVQPEDKTRGMVSFQHRQFLPQHWQLTLESFYLSDEYFLESFRRNDFLNGKEQETIIHLKWLKDNQAFSVLGKWRINDFQDQLEELPSAQYHLKAQSLFDDKFTLYSDSFAGRMRQRVGENHDFTVKQEFYTFGSHRTELDFPLKYKSGNIVPFVAGTFGYDDRSGFARDIATGTGNQFGDQEIFIGQAGVRASTQYWKLYKNARSKFWDIDGIRHIVKPYANVSVFANSSDSAEQKDIYSLGVLQRWQTKRGEGDKQRVLDWMRLKLEYTKVGQQSDVKRPDRTIWNDDLIPLSIFSAPRISNGDLNGFRQFELFGPQRDNVYGDYIWRLSDSTAILSDFTYATQDSELEQFDVGISRLIWPDLSIYVGTRYLKNIENNDGKKGSNTVTFAMTYRLTPRYTISLAHQYDFRIRKSIATEVSIIRRYHRLYYGLTYSIDETLDRRAVILNIWPEGIGELAFGSRSFMGLDNPTERND